jgi:hypothetical protein
MLETWQIVTGPRFNKVVGTFEWHHDLTKLASHIEVCLNVLRTHCMTDCLTRNDEMITSYQPYLKS